jgi:hypothetical protein
MVGLLLLQLLGWALLLLVCHFIRRYSAPPKEQVEEDQW